MRCDSLNQTMKGNKKDEKTESATSNDGVTIETNNEGNQKEDKLEGEINKTVTSENEKELVNRKKIMD